MTLFFPDVSEWQPSADIPRILEKSRGLLAIRACYGVGYKDKKFDQFRRAASAQAKVLFIYQFVVNSQQSARYGGSPTANADYFAKCVGKLRENEVPVIDVEPGSGAWTKSQVETWRKRVQEKCGGRKAVVYSNEGYITSRNLGSLFTSTDGWVAKWGKTGRDASTPKYPYLMWQHAGDGFGRPRHRWPGTASGTDENRSERAYADFVTAALGDPTPPKPVPKPSPTYKDVMVGSTRVRVHDGSPTLQKGSTGAHVRWLQHMLKYGFGQAVSIDGDFGPNTESAVRSMQRRLHVTADGQYGPNTARAALKALS